MSVKNSIRCRHQAVHRLRSGDPGTNPPSSVIDAMRQLRKRPSGAQRTVRAGKSTQLKTNAPRHRSIAARLSRRWCFLGVWLEQMIGRSSQAHRPCPCRKTSRPAAIDGKQVLQKSHVVPLDSSATILLPAARRQTRRRHGEIPVIEARRQALLGQLRTARSPCALKPARTVSVTCCPSQQRDSPHPGSLSPSTNANPSAPSINC